MPHDLPAEESDAPGGGTDDPVLDIVMSWEGGGGSGIAMQNVMHLVDVGDHETFNNEHATVRQWIWYSYVECDAPG